MVARELASHENRLDQREPVLRPVAHRDRRRSVELDDGGWIETQQHVVQAYDLAPVGCTGRGCLRVQRGDRRLQLKDTDPAQRECLLDQLDSFLYLYAVP